VIYAPPSYSWFYGTYQHGSQIWTNNPSDGSGHHFFDEVRTLLPQMAAGAKVRLQKDATSTASSYTIDLADFEQVSAALSQPGGSTSIISTGADPSGVNDSTAAIQNAINGSGTIWMPTGIYKCGHINIPDNVTIQGASEWYTRLDGLGVSIAAPDSPARNNVHVSDLSIFGEDPIRDDSLRNESIAGGWTNSSFSNIWTEHTKVGIWAQPGTTNTTFSSFRIRDTMADGVNFGGGVATTTVTQSMIRNTGDDGMAMWSWNVTDHDDTFSYNTVQMPNLANNIGVYGGYNNTISNNYVADTLWNGGGIHIGNRFGGVGFGGINTISGNTLQRTGSFNKDNGWPVGAIWFYASDSAMAATINVNNNQINDSSYAAIQFVGSSVSNVTLNTKNILGAGTYGVQIQSAGGASFTAVTASLLGVPGIYQCGTSFTITQGAGNSGWNSSPTCPGSWPNPIYQPILTSTPTATNTPCPGTCPTNTPTATNTPTPTPIPGTVVAAINAGGSAAGNFSADTDFNQGSTASDTSAAIDTTGYLDTNIAPQVVYQSCRWAASFTYTIPGLSAGGTYVVLLHWAELTFNGAGPRKFNVAINGSAVLTNFDVVANSGYKKALGRSFSATANASGQIVIAFSQGSVDNPSISGIEILSQSGGATNTPAPSHVPTVTPQATATSTPGTGNLITAINAGGAASGSYIADTAFDSGTQFSDTSAVIDTSGGFDSNPAPQSVYQSLRWNSAFTYSLIGLNAGTTYTVRLHWAELTFNGAGLRKFNVAINDASVLTNFDVVANSGHRKALGKTFTTTPNASRQIIIAFTQGSVDNPFVSGIEILSQGAGPTPTPQPTATNTPGGLSLITAINAGGGASGSYIADTGFSAGTQFSDTSAVIDTSGGFDSNPAPQSVYQSLRWNNAFTYTISGLTAGVSYTVRLHWAELTFNGSGLRKFNVAINGTSVLTNFDVVANSG